MKKLIFAMLAIFAISSVSPVLAQKLSKEEKAALAEKQAAENKKLYDYLFQQKNLIFVATSVEIPSGGRATINHFQYLRVRPDAIQSDLQGVDKVGGVKIDTNRYEVVKNEEVKGIYNLQLKCEGNGQQYTIDIAANSKNGTAIMKVKSNKATDRIYRGSVKEN